MKTAAILFLALAGSAVGQTSVRIATWNVLGVGARGSAPYNAVRDTLHRIRPDAVGINEVAGSSDVVNLQNLAADTGYDVIVVQASNPFGGERNAILSRFPLVRSAINTSASLSGDPLANDLTRLVVEATLDVPGNARDLTIVCIHLKSGFADSDEFRRAVEAIRAGQAVATLSRQTDAYVILGDLNEEVSNVPQNPNPFTLIPSGMPGGWRLGADLAARLPSGIRNDPFFHLLLDTGPDVSPINAAQLDGSQATRPVSGRRIDYILPSQAVFGLSHRGEVYDSADEGLPGGLPKFGPPLAPGTSEAASDHLLVFADVTVPAGAHPPMHMVFASATSVPGLGVAGPLDVVRYDHAANTWSLVFRGSDHGLTTAIDALAVLPGGKLLFSFADPVDLPGLTGAPGGGTLVDDSDLVEFTPPPTGFVISRSGPPTMFSFYLDGSDLGLDQDGEDIDAVEILPDGRLLLSTTGAFSIPGLSGEDVDLIVFTPTSLGEHTAGTLAMHFDGSDVGLSGNTGEDVDAVAVTISGAILLSTTGDFFVPGVSGANEDVLGFTPTSLGPLTAGSYTLFLDLSTLGIDPAADLSALDIDG